MTDILVSIRLPPTLLEEIKSLTREQHFVDQSELIRSVLRSGYEKHTQDQVQNLTESIIKDLRKNAVTKSEARLSEELRKIKDRLREELK